MYLRLAAAAVAVAAALAAARLWAPGIPAGVEVAVPHSDAGAPPICPWRDPPGDLRALFGPGASYSTEILVLSGARAWLVKHVGPTAEPLANVLYVHRVHRGGAVVGSVLTGRARGRFGAIEVVVGVDARGGIEGVRIQRSREIGAPGRLLASGHWLAAFRGKHAGDAFRPGEDLPAAEYEAQDTARSVARKVREMLLELLAPERFHTGRLRGGL